MTNVAHKDTLYVSHIDTAYVVHRNSVSMDICTGIPVLGTLASAAADLLGIYTGIPVIGTLTAVLTTAYPVGIVTLPPLLGSPGNLPVALTTDILTIGPSIGPLIAKMIAKMHNIVVGDPVVEDVVAEYIFFETENSQLVYIFTLTGDPDIKIPISSFQGRLRSGSNTYLSVVIPGVDYALEISDRADGQMVIEAAYNVAGIQRKIFEIIRVNLETIRMDEGSINKSITLTGYRQETYTSKSVILTGKTYKSINDGKLLYRFAEPDLTLTPGDVVTIGYDSFTADVISYYVSPATCQMEVSES